MTDAAEKNDKTPEAVEVDCCMCGKKDLSTIEGDGGSECQLSDGRWVCSYQCWDSAVLSTLIYGTSG